MQSPNLRVLVAVVHDVLNVARFSRRDDFEEAVKCRCATLRLAYDTKAIAAAIGQVEHGGKRRDIPSMTADAAPPAGRRPGPTGDVSPADATKILAALRRRMTVVGPRMMPDPQSPTPAQLVARNIVSSIARCEQLETLVQSKGAEPNGADDSTTRDR